MQLKRMSQNGNGSQNGNNEWTEKMTRLARIVREVMIDVVNYEYQSNATNSPTTSSVVCLCSVVIVDEFK